MKTKKDGENRSVKSDSQFSYEHAQLWVDIFKKISPLAREQRFVASLLSGLYSNLSGQCLSPVYNPALWACKNNIDPRSKLKNNKFTTVQQGWLWYTLTLCTQNTEILFSLLCVQCGQSSVSSYLWCVLASVASQTWGLLPRAHTLHKRQLSRRVIRVIRQELFIAESDTSS